MVMMLSVSVPHEGLEVINQTALLLRDVLFRSPMRGWKHFRRVGGMADGVVSVPHEGLEV